MKSEKIYDGITGIRDDIIEQAEKKSLSEKKPVFNRGWKAAAALLLIIVIIGGVVFAPGRNGSVASAYALAEAEYPERTAYPMEADYVGKDGELDYEAYDKAFDVWWEEQRTRRIEGDHISVSDEYLTTTIKQFLADSEGKNKVFSPLNVYLALGMLAETTGGESREEILAVLGMDTIEELRKNTVDLWEYVYRKDGSVNSVLASSLWLDESFEVNKEVVNQLAKSYYASSYQGEMGSAAFDEAFQKWLNEQTGDLLKEQVKGQKFSPEAVMSLASTIFFQAKWTNEFRPENTKKDTFYGAEKDVTADFMRDSYMDTYYYGERFSAVTEPLDNVGKMWFILPDEGVTVDELLSDGEIFSVFLEPHNWEAKKHVLIHISLPKFDVTSQMKLTEELKEMGIQDVFDDKTADFSPLTEEEGIFLSKVQHDARVGIDEEGVTAAAYTVMELCGSAMPNEEVEFTLDRPFLFVIATDNNLPLFAGVVNQL